MPDSLARRPDVSPIKMKFSIGDIGIVRPIDERSPESGAAERTESLVFMVPPKNMTIRWQKSIVTEETLGAFVEYHWGENVPIINASGTTMGFMSYDKRDFVFLPGNDREFSPYTRAVLLNPDQRRVSLAYENFQDILRFYSNNGITLHRGGPLNGLVKEVQDIVMDFDNGKYIGRFETFTFEENANNPHMFTYNFVFRAYRSQILLG